MNDIERATAFYRAVRNSVNDTAWGIHTEIHRNRDKTFTVTCCVAEKKVIRCLRQEAAQDGLPIASVIGVPGLPLVTCTVTTRHCDYSALDYNPVYEGAQALNQPVAEILDARAYLHGIPALCADQPEQALCLHPVTEYGTYTLMTAEMLSQQVRALAETHLSVQLPLIPAHNTLFY